MPKILIFDCKQEISSFNPLISTFDNFRIETGEKLYAHRGRNTELGGALAVFEARPDVQVVPSLTAQADSAGILSAAGWQALSTRFLQEIQANLDGIDAIYACMHGAMGAEGELDPEGYLLSEIRKMVGPDLPIVLSLDLHGILTDRMIRQVNGIVIYHTYPHVDFADTGRRAAELLLKMLDEGLRPVLARAVIPALVRGDELITATGFFGDLIRDCRRLEREGSAVAAGIMIGNPFTDVPELCSQVIVQTQSDADLAQSEAERLAAEFWPQRFRMQGKFFSVERAIAQAKSLSGPVIFTDAADATSSGATGDSNLILSALQKADYQGRVLAIIVDPAAAAAAHLAGVGATVEVTLGGAHDPARFLPMPARARIKTLTDGNARLETMKRPLVAGPTAVLTWDNYTVVVISVSVSLFDRAMYYASGCNPQDYDLIVVKSPHCEHHMFEAWAEKNFNIDVPGATSANLPTLGHTICARPMYPMEPETSFTPKAVIYWLDS